MADAVLLFQGGLGAVWDREWHAYVGRDQFWTLPHTLIYSSVSGVGLIALAMVLPVPLALTVGVVLVFALVVTAL